MDFKEKIASNHYRNNLPYSPEKLNHEVHEAYVKEDKRLYNEFKADLKGFIEGSLGPINQRQFEAIFSFVWSAGHANGYYEVLNYTRSLLPMVEELIKKG